MKKLSTLALLLYTACAPASGASEPSSSGASGAELASNGGDKEYFKWECTRERPTGSNISREVCRPKPDTAAHQKAMEDIQRRSNTINGGPERAGT